MADVLVQDTSILVDQQRGDPRAASYVTSLRQRNTLSIHPITAAEMLAGALDRAGLARTKAMLSYHSSGYSRCGISISSPVWASCSDTRLA